jgi:hypothetical protein
MDEGLWEVAEELSGDRIDLFGVQPDVVGVPEQLVEEDGSLVRSTGLRECVGEPDRAREKRAVLALDTVVADVAPDERPVGELSAEALIVPRRRPRFESS